MIIFKNLKTVLNKNSVKGSLSTNMKYKNATNKIQLPKEKKMDNTTYFRSEE